MLLTDTQGSGGRAYFYFCLEILIYGYFSNWLPVYLMSLCIFGVPVKNKEIIYPFHTSESFSAKERLVIKHVFQPEYCILETSVGIILRVNNKI